MEVVDEIREIIFLNKCEVLCLTKEYFVMYLISLMKDCKGSENRKVLIEKLKEYYEIVREENDYMRFLLRNMESINNEEKLNDTLDTLDILNEKTYIFYDNILKEYEDNIFFDNLERKIVPYKDFQTLIETDSYLREILGLTLGVKDLEEYYAEEAEAFNYLRGNTKVFDIPIEEGMDFYGCYLKEKETDGVLTGINICVPKITDLKSMSINISVFRCGLDLYQYIGSVLPKKEFTAKNTDEERQFRKKYLNREKLFK